ncbi:BLUF domain-containing protein [Rhodopila sp.]|uniref:BLUF domain-containing protein n=1 Tax=Rhodopila sp. TaxID=2480087 RepID=UPI003D13A3DE
MSPIGKKRWGAAMLDTHASTPNASTASAGVGSTATAALATMVYRSRAVRPLSGLDLHRLTQAAQARNRAECITGLVLYDGSRFFQWLEGPRESLARIMRSILNDVRHTDIHVLHNQPIAARCFGDWSMQLVTMGGRAGAWKHDVVQPPRRLILDLRRDPDAAPALLARLAPRKPALAVSSIAASGFAPPPSHEPTATILQNLIMQTVMPRVAVRRALAGGSRIPPPGLLDGRADQLAHLLIGSDPAAALQLIKQIQAGERSDLRLYSRLFEPAARRLGDLFSQDRCSEVDVGFGLCRLQTAIRVLGASNPPRSRPMPSAPDVLLVTQPGELHTLGAVLDAEVLWHAGWAPRFGYPADDAALQALLAATWFDALDLSLSSALRREHWLGRISRTIAAARSASLNPNLAIVVSGRLFADQSADCDAVGADTAITTALQIRRAILLTAENNRAQPTIQGAPTAPKSLATQHSYPQPA